MRNPIPTLILGLHLLFTPVFVHADFSKPTGIWDLHGKFVLTTNLSAKKFKVAPKTTLPGIVQFKADSAYAAIPWAKTPGKWLSTRPGGKAYKVSFEAGALASGQSKAPFLNALLVDFVALANQSFGKAPQLQGIAIKSYTDRGLLAKKGLQLTGVIKINATITYLNPATNQSETSKLKATINYLGTRASAPSDCCTGTDPAQNLADSQAFLAENITLPGVQGTASGLQYLAIDAGTGNPPVDTSKVTIAYREILPNGQYLGGGSNETFSPGNIALKGLREGLELMPEGAYYRLYLPPALAYGAAGAGTTIPPNSALIFDVVLTKVQ